MEEITASWVRGRLPRRDPMGHKGTFGKVLCICGSVGFSGAAGAGRLSLLMNFTIMKMQSATMKKFSTV